MVSTPATLRQPTYGQPITDLVAEAFPTSDPARLLCLIATHERTPFISLRVLSNMDKGSSRGTWMALPLRST